MHKHGKSTKYFFWTFSSFCFHSIRSHVMVFVVQISFSNKSYRCVDGIHAKEIVKNSYFECFPAISYLSFIRYHPVEMVRCLSREGDKVPMHVRKTKWENLTIFGWLALLNLVFDLCQWTKLNKFVPLWNILLLSFGTPCTQLNLCITNVTL